MLLFFSFNHLDFYKQATFHYIQKLEYIKYQLQLNHKAILLLIQAIIKVINDLLVIYLYELLHDTSINSNYQFRLFQI